MGQRALCVVDVDGANLHCNALGGSDDLALVGWTDERRVIVARTDHGKRVLERLNVDDGTIDCRDQRGVGGSLSPDGRFMVCRCPPQGYSAGTWVIYPFERPGEFTVLHPVEADSVAIDFDWSPTSPRLPYISTLKVLTGLGAPQRSAAYQLRITGQDIAGREVAIGVVRWRSEDTLVATVDSGGRLTPRDTGAVTIDATAGGWRSARISLRISDPPARVLLDEDWSRGLEPAWVGFGVPMPVLDSSSVLRHAFLNNGDGSFFSGAYTSHAYSTKDGLWVETRLSTKVTATDGQDQVMSLFAMLDTSKWAKWDHVTGDGPVGVASPGWSFRFPIGDHLHRLGEHFFAYGLEMGEHILTAPVDAGTGTPYRFVMQIFPDGSCGLALDGKVSWIGPAVFFQRSVHLMIAGNSVGTKFLVGRLRIRSGIAPEFRQLAIPSISVSDTRKAMRATTRARRQ